MLDEKQFQLLEKYLEEISDLIGKINFDEFNEKMVAATKNLEDKIQEIKLQIPENYIVDGEVTIKNQLDLEELKQANLEALEKFTKYLNDTKVKEVTVKDLNKLKVEPKIKVNIEHLASINKKLDGLLKQAPPDFPSSINVGNWPKEPREAIPVVLTDKKRKSFYDAVSRLISGSGGIDRVNYAVRVMVDSVNSNIKYIGEAEPGHLTSQPFWRIRKVEKSGSNSTVTWANGNANFENIYDNRESVTYV